MRVMVVGASGGPALFNITDDESATMNEWVPALAKALGAKRELGWALRYPSWRSGFPASFRRHVKPVKDQN